jgi:hypothetical protein
MKYMRIFNAILVFILVYMLLGFSTPVAADDVAVSIDVTTTPQPQGSDFIATIISGSIINFDVGQYDITYDPAVIQVKTDGSGAPLADNGNINGIEIPVSSCGFYPPNPGTQGTIRVINNVPGTPGVTGSGYLAKIHFHVVGAAGTSSAISLSNVILGDKDAQQIPATWTDGTVQVAAISSPPDSVGGGGGGGGSGGSNDKMTTGLRGISSQEGEVWENVKAPSFDGKMWLDIPYGTMVKNRNGYALTSITITTIAELNTPQTGNEIIGGIYDLSPSGTTFDPPITLTVKYDASLIPEGVSEDSLFIAYWDENKLEWVPINGTVNKEEDTITILISHFSTYAIMAKTLPASFVLSDLSVVPSEMRPADKAVITVKVANAGDLKGSYEVILLVNGIRIETRQITLAGRTSQEVTFTYTPVKAGSYNITIANMTSTFKAVVPVTETEPSAVSVPKPANTSEPVPVPKPAPAPTPTPARTPTPAPTPVKPAEALPVQPPTNWGLIGGIIAACIIVVGLLGYFVISRKHSTSRP